MRVVPSVVAEVVDSLAGRVKKRTDALLADRSAWSLDGLVASFGNANVRLADVEVITSPDQVVCDCLLAPACAHRAAVVASLEVDDGAEPKAGADEAPEADDEGESVVLSARQRDALSMARSHLEELLMVGAHRLPVSLRSALHADLHRLRVHSLVNLDRSLTGLVTSLDGPPSSRVSAMAAALGNLWRLQRADGPVDRELVGRVRQSYRDVGGLLLQPLVAEPVLAASGFSGAAVTFVDAQRRTWALSRVAPGGREGVRQRYETGEPWAGITDPPKGLSRRTIMVSNATASASGRLGGGRSVRAAVRGVWSGWGDVPEGYAVVEGAIASGDRSGLVIGEQRLRLTPVARQLGAGLATELFGRVVGGGARALVRASSEPELLGLTSTDGTIMMPDDLHGVWWPGLDEVTRDWVGLLGEATPEDDIDPAEWLADSPSIRQVTHRWLARVLDAGPSVLRADLIRDDAAWLRRAGAPFAAELLERLGAAPQEGSRRFDGTWQADPAPLADAWLALASY